MITWFNSRKVGGKLESRVIKWFDYLWANKNSMDEEMVLNMLPEKLKVRFRVSNRNSVARNFAQLFSNCPEFQGSQLKSTCEENSSKIIM